MYIFVINQRYISMYSLIKCKSTLSNIAHHTLCIIPCALDITTQIYIVRYTHTHIHTHIHIHTHTLTHTHTISYCDTSYCNVYSSSAIV